MKSITVEICAGTACHVMGANTLSNLMQTLEPSLKNAVKVKLTHCLGNCGEGPNVKVEGVLYSRVTADRLHQIIRQHCGQE